MSKTITKENLSISQEYWNRKLGEYKDWFSSRYPRYAAKYDEYSRVFIEFIEPKGKVLDIGCCEGRLSLLLPKDCQYYGIDPLVVKRISSFPFKQALGENIPYPKNSFDIVLIKSTLDHVRDPMKVLQEASRICKKDGKFGLANIVHSDTISFYKCKDHTYHFEKQQLLDIVSQVFIIQDFKITRKNILLVKAFNDSKE